MRAFVLVLVAAASVGQNTAFTTGTRTIDLAFGGRVRQYVLHVPPASDGALVLVFHGGGQRAVQIRQISGFDALADREHFIVAYPEAFERSWADGRKVTIAEQQGIDDVGFAKAVVADIARAHTVDRSRVFAAGLSNGGALSHRLACDASDTFAAIGTVGGNIATNIVGSCRPAAPVALIAVQGLADPSVIPEGGDVGGSPRGGHLQGHRTTQELWRSLNGCAPAATSTSMPVVVQDGTSVVRRSYANCRGMVEVVGYEIEGGGHRWPPHVFDGPAEAASRRENGISSQNLNASEVIWAFFAAHARR